MTTARLVKGCRLKYICVRQNESQVPDGYVKVVGHQNLSKYSDIQGVILSTPAETHYQIAKDLLRQSYHLLIEKPMTTDYQQAVRLARWQHKKGLQILVGHTYVYHPSFIKAKSVVKKIGKISRVDFEGLNKDPMERGLSCLWEWGPHGVALACDVIGKPPIAVTAWQKNDQKILMKLRFKNKTEARLMMGWSFPEKKRKITVKGNGGSIVIDLMAGGKPTPLAMELKEFVKMIVNNKPPRTDINQGLLTVKVLSAAELSLNQGEQLI